MLNRFFPRSTFAANSGKIMATAVLALQSASSVDAGFDTFPQGTGEGWTIAYCSMGGLGLIIAAACCIRNCNRAEQANRAVILPPTEPVADYTAMQNNL